MNPTVKSAFCDLAMTQCRVEPCESRNRFWRDDDGS